MSIFLLDELFVILLFLVTLASPSLFSLCYFAFSLLLLYSPSSRAKSRVLSALTLLLFINMALLSLFQLPFFPSLTRHSGWLGLLESFGIRKWMSDAYDGMAMCLQSGVVRTAQTVVKCQKYASFSAMGFYVTLLVLFYLYVRLTKPLEP